MVVINFDYKYLCCLLIVFGVANAQVLPEDRVDTLYHSYDGGGIEVNGPSVLVRKSVVDSVSISANYYVDSISSASIDVVTSGASRYSEKRTQKSAGIDYLHDSSIMSFSYTSSLENDFEAETTNFSISQEMFGGLTTIGLGFKYGDNVVMNSTDNAFREQAESNGYRVSLSQVLTKNILLGSAYEIITDNGYLNNPYRRVRYVSTEGLGYSFEPEIYPRTHTSNAVGVSLRYFLPYRASVSVGYRYYIDSWDIEANTFDIGYVHPWQERWLFDASLRFYSQTSASFYQDLFTTVSVIDTDYRARDKELSTYNSYSMGIGATYKLGDYGLIEKSSINLYYNYFLFSYDNFRDIPTGVAQGLTGGNEPLYEFHAGVIRLFFSAWF